MPTPNFVFSKVSVVKNRAYFEYQYLENQNSLYTFTETIEFPESYDLEQIETTKLNAYLKLNHLLLGLSYYKLYAPQTIQHNYQLSPEEAEFFSTIYKNGLGEFAYNNKIDLEHIAQFEANSLAPKAKFNYQKEKVASKYWLGIGGGKDSFVAIEELRLLNVDFDLLFIETGKPNSIVDDMAKTAGLNLVKIKRHLDPQIHELSKTGLNGHIPISAIFAGIGLLFAELTNYRGMLVANEHSSNFGNLDYCGQEINHQWSKSEAFELAFNNYLKTEIQTTKAYISCVRQLSELKIVELATKYPQYWPVFTSCNRSFRVEKERQHGLWCLSCAKCCFAYLMFAAFLTPSELAQIFPENLWEKPELVQTFRDLLGIGEMKPFDCVGTFAESRAALSLARQKDPNTPQIQALDQLVDARIDKITRQAELKEAFSRQPAANLPASYKLLGLKEVGILGYGREGKITFEYLNTTYPHLELKILDQTLDYDYLDKASSLELVIKSPGIKPDLVKTQYETATNLFFEQLHYLPNLTIGITGSKGKSTTASLCYQLLKTANKQAILIGNIGKPMLEYLEEIKCNPELIVVLELSSYMLNEINYAPRIAIITNLFPEHMDYHGGLASYYEAKAKITLKQNPDDALIINESNPELITLSTRTKAQVWQKATDFDFSNYRGGLIGEHNFSNMQLVASLGRLLKIDDQTINQAFSEFQPLKHRLEFIGEIAGVKYYDDAISTTPESTIMAIKALKPIAPISTILLGGSDRGYDFGQLRDLVIETGISNIVLFQESGTKIFPDETRQANPQLNFLVTDSMTAAVEFAKANSTPNSICLLSTASPSYSLWENFEAKGQAYRKAIF